MPKWAAVLLGVAGLALGASILTEATLAYGKRGWLSNDQGKTRVTASPSPTVTPVATSSPMPSPVPTSIPTPSPTPTPQTTATVVSYVHLRAGASTSTQILTDLYGGEVVTLLSGGDALWQEVQYKGWTGYIYKSYLRY